MKPEWTKVICGATACKSNSGHNDEDAWEKENTYTLGEITMEDVHDARFCTNMETPRC